MSGRFINVGCAQWRLNNFENYDLVDRGSLEGPSWATWHGPFTLVRSWEEIDFTDAEVVYLGHLLEHLPRGTHHLLLAKIAKQAPRAYVGVAVPIIDNAPEMDWGVLQDVLSFPQNEQDLPASHRQAFRKKDILKDLKIYWEQVAEWPECPFATSHDTFIQVIFRCVHAK